MTKQTKRKEIHTAVIPVFERAKRALLPYLRVYPNCAGNELWQWCDIVACEFEPPVSNAAQARRMALREQLLAYVQESRESLNTTDHTP